MERGERSSREPNARPEGSASARAGTVVNADRASRTCALRGKILRMGFTPWPSELSAAGLEQSKRFMEANGDVTSIMLIGGIPWQEALDNKPFSADVEQRLGYRPPEGTRVFLSISPLAMNRRDLAPYWGERENMPLPAAWRDLPFDDPKVIKSLGNFANRAVRKLKPDYLAIGIESNALLTFDQSKWPAYRNMHRSVYATLKKSFPKLPIFFTTEVNHFLGRSDGANIELQSKEVGELMRSSDWFAMSYYPHMTFNTKWPIPDNFLISQNAFANLLPSAKPE